MSYQETKVNIKATTEVGIDKSQHKIIVRNNTEN